MTAPRTDAVTVEQMLAATDMMKRILKRAVKNAVANDTSDQEFLVDFLVRKNFIYLEKKTEAIRDFLSASTNTIDELQRENERLRGALENARGCLCAVRYHWPIDNQLIDIQLNELKAALTPPKG